MHLRLLHFGKLNDAAGCRDTAEKWEALQRTDVAGLYDAACFRATTAAITGLSDTSADGVKKAGAEADRAMVWLQKAVAAGYRDVVQMVTDGELYALRDRDDFKKLVAELSKDKK
jgi:hypothetical protein